MAINDGNRPIVGDSTIFDNDAVIETGKNNNIPKGNKGKQGTPEEVHKKKKEANESQKKGWKDRKSLKLIIEDNNDKEGCKIPPYHYPYFIFRYFIY